MVKGELELTLDLKPLTFADGYEKELESRARHFLRGVYSVAINGVSVFGSAFSLEFSKLFDSNSAVSVRVKSGATEKCSFIAGTDSPLIVRRTADTPDLAIINTDEGDWAWNLRKH